MAPADTAQAREASNPSRCGLFAYLQKTFDFQSLRRGIFLANARFSVVIATYCRANALCSMPDFNYQAFTQHLLNASSAFVSEF